MKKLTTVLIIAGVAGAAAAAAYMPVKVGDTLEQQIQKSIASANASSGTSGIHIAIQEYNKHAYQTDLITRLTFQETQSGGGDTSYLDIRHTLDHGLSGADFRSEIIVTESMQDSLSDFQGKVPLHFDGHLSADDAVINTYIEGFTLQRDDGTIRVNPGLIRLNYDQNKAGYTLNGSWNGARLLADDTEFHLGQVNLEGQGQKLTQYLWGYNNQLTIETAGMSNPVQSFRSGTLKMQDRFEIKAQENQPDTLNYNGRWSVQDFSVEQYGQPLYQLRPSGFSYSLTGPTVTGMESLLAMTEQMDPSQMTQEEARKILPAFADVVNAVRFRLHDVELVTPEGRLKGEARMRMDTDQQELIQALSFPPLLTNYLHLETEAVISKSLFDSVPVLGMMAMQLNQLDAYQEDEDDMLVEADLQNGQLTINDVPIR